MATTKGAGKGGAKEAQWFQTGAAGWQKAKQADAEAKARREAQGPRRYWLHSESSGKVTFLDTPNFFIKEHNVKIGDNFHNYFTCRSDFGECPLCQSGLNPSYVLIGTVINHTPYEEKKTGKEINHTKQLFVAKGRARERMQKAIERAGEKGLTLGVVECTRGSSPTECATGEDFFLKGYLSEEKLKAARDKYGHDYELKPFDYAKLFYPKTEEELRKVIGAGPPIGSEEELSGSTDDLLGDPDSAGGAEAGTEGDSIDDLI